MLGWRLTVRSQERLESQRTESMERQFDEKSRRALLRDDHLGLHQVQTQLAEIIGTTFDTYSEVSILLRDIFRGQVDKVTAMERSQEYDVIAFHRRVLMRLSVVGSRLHHEDSKLYHALVWALSEFTVQLRDASNQASRGQLSEDDLDMLDNGWRDLLDGPYDRLRSHLSARKDRCRLELQGQSPSPVSHDERSEEE
jgi:hypothetical protein